MPTYTMPVARRVSLLQQIFRDFGIPVTDNSVLDRTIRKEFGPGKRSKLNQLLNDYNKQTDAAYLSVCIGAELRREFAEPDLVALGNLMCERLPSLLEIIDIRQQVARREQALQGILEYIRNKLPSEGTESLERMLVAAEDQLHRKLQTQMLASIVEQTGTVFACSQLRTAGTILGSVMPALISLEHAKINPSQTINLVINAIRVMATEFKQNNLNQAANIIDYVHCLAQLHLPVLSEECSVEDILTRLDIPFAKSTARILSDRSRSVGLYDQELLKILQSNQRHAATCGVLAKLAQDIDCPPLEKIAVSGLCFLTLKQTYTELKTGNLQAVNFSESSGILLTNLGNLTNNRLLSKLGIAVTNGVKTYTGLLATPGGASVALPLAICTVLGKLMLKGKNNSTSTRNTILEKNLHDIDVLQRVVQWHFADLQRTLERQHQELVVTMQRGFANIIDFVGRWQQFEQRNWQQLLDIEYSIHSGFRDLYIEYIRDPLEQFDYAVTYNAFAMLNVAELKFKLKMWLLYKSKHPKANGRSLPDSAILKVTAPDHVLGLLNKYANQEFYLNLPEDLPHMPTWLLAVHAFVELSMLEEDRRDVLAMHDIIRLGDNILGYIETLRADTEFYNQMNIALQGLRQREAEVLQQLAPPEELPIVRKLARPAAWERQLERFSAVVWDLSEHWVHYALSEEYSLAEFYQLGSLTAEYIVLRSNTFTEVHMAYGAAELPVSSQLIKFRIEIYFKYQTRQYLLASSMHAYYLATAQDRFEKYYRQKFQYPLKHTRYDWISIDGTKNQISGHIVTDCKKLINYTKLGSLYQRWFADSQLLEVESHPQPELLYQLQTEIAARRSEAQTSSNMAQSTNAELVGIQNKLALNTALQAAFSQILDGQLASELEHVLGRLRLLLPETNDIMPTLGL